MNGNTKQYGAHVLAFILMLRRLVARKEAVVSL